MPVCDRCSHEKEAKAFASRKHAPGRRHPTCKACVEELQSLGYQFCSTCLRWMWADNFYHKTTCSDCYTAWRYGMSPLEYENFCIAHGSSCGICGSTGRLVVDHNHETGSPRGRLCHSCNVALGHFRDNEQILQKAIDYLTNSNRRYTLGASLEDVFWPGDEVT